MALLLVGPAVADGLVGRLGEDLELGLTQILLFGVPEPTSKDATGSAAARDDGLVPEASAELPGADNRVLALADHASPVMDVDPFKNFWTVEQRNDTTWSLIKEVRRLASDATRSGAASP